MHRNPSITAIATLIIVGLLSGCATSNNQAEIEMAPSPTATESEKPANTDTEIPTYTPRLDYTKDIVLAKNETELEFLTIALASCQKAQTDGFVAKTSEGESIFRADVEGLWPFWPFDQVSIVDGKTVFGETEVLFNMYWPSLFDPCDLEASARSRDPDDVYLEHKLTKVDENTYIWAQHQGGANLNEMTYEVTDGLITGYARDETYATQISYGPLTESQIALLDQAEQE